jgi:hypothetical protein
MKKCEECGKKLGILKGYIHPTMGKKHHLCSPCYNQVSYSVEKWREFVLSNSFKATPSKNKTWAELKRIKPNFKKAQNMPEHL